MVSSGSGGHVIGCCWPAGRETEAEGRFDAVGLEPAVEVIAGGLGEEVKQGPLPLMAWEYDATMPEDDSAEA